MIDLLTIREEQAGDIEAIYQLNLSAFEGPAEADLVDALRANCSDRLSLVAEDNGIIVGHILFSPTTLITADAKHPGMGLAPMSVLPERQRTGVGSALIQEGLKALRSRGVAFVVVLGHADYYSRFGFAPAASLGIQSEFSGIPDEAFMIQSLDPDAALEPGTIRYHSEFDAFK